MPVDMFPGQEEEEEGLERKAPAKAKRRKAPAASQGSRSKPPTRSRYPCMSKLNYILLIALTVAEIVMWISLAVDSRLDTTEVNVLLGVAVGSTVSLGLLVLGVWERCRCCQGVVHGAMSVIVIANIVSLLCLFLLFTLNEMEKFLCTASLIVMGVLCLSILSQWYCMGGKEQKYDSVATKEEEVKVDVEDPKKGKGKGIGIPMPSMPSWRKKSGTKSDNNKKLSKQPSKKYKPPPPPSGHHDEVELHEAPKKKNNNNNNDEDLDEFERWQAEAGVGGRVEPPKALPPPVETHAVEVEMDDEEAEFLKWQQSE